MAPRQTARQPVGFDLWVRVKKGEEQAAKDALAGGRMTTRLQDLHADVRMSTILGTWLVVEQGLSWAQVNDLRGAIAKWAEEAKICQTGCAPESSTGHCELHDLHHSWPEGCPICLEDRR